MGMSSGIWLAAYGCQPGRKPGVFAKPSLINLPMAQTKAGKPFTVPLLATQHFSNAAPLFESRDQAFERN